ncbi:hypothetical protein AKO1_014271 [Acrasis kona]|uniref:Uncharacterized protein n=1 Tax=Acrasis kona TaxID=1008807 RepID=A0AAW2Z2A9_9EUKA
MEDDEDLYDDLIVVQKAVHEALAKQDMIKSEPPTPTDVSQQNDKLLIMTLRLENQRLKKMLDTSQKENEQLKINISQLFITAKHEIKEKEQQIHSLSEQLKESRKIYHNPESKRMKMYAPEEFPYDSSSPTAQPSPSPYSILVQNHNRNI